MSPAPAAHPVLLRGESPTGLADLLHQFLCQSLESSPEKRRLARRLDGAICFRAVEDDAVRVRIAFFGDRIEIADLAPDAEERGAPELTADFLATAALTTGERGPLSLWVGRRMRARFSARQARFLLRVLRLMRIDPAPEVRARRRRALLTAAATALLLVALAILARG